MPTHNDPKIFMISCAPRVEPETAMGIMSKYFDVRDTDEQFDIISAISLTKMPRTIFIESHSLFEVKKAINGFNSVN